jgi:hypothetical protein
MAAPFLVFERCGSASLAALLRATRARPDSLWFAGETLPQTPIFALDPPVVMPSPLAAAAPGRPNRSARMQQKNLFNTAD